MRKKIVAGNWKMNLSFDEGVALTKAVTEKYVEKKDKELILIPPFIHLSKIKDIVKNKKVKVGAQNCHHMESGAYTGEVSAAQLKSLKLEYCLVGHSERRKYNKENNEQLLGKIKMLLTHGIRPIFCCGESLEARESEQHFKAIAKQLKVLWGLTADEFEHIVIAYEPIWAIGTGKTATAAQAQEIHEFIRALINEHYRKRGSENCSILYGGSCNPNNAEELFSQKDVDGGLIGGASLNADDFIAVYNALR